MKNISEMSYSKISKIVKDSRIICNNNVLQSCKLLLSVAVNFSYSIIIKLKSNEKKIVKKGFPIKSNKINKIIKAIVEINLCLNS